MLELELPWVLGALAAPLLLIWWLPAYREQRPGVQVPFFERLVEVTGQRPTERAVEPRANLFQRFVLLPVTWTLVVIAMAGPVWVEPPIVKSDPARDLLLAVDISGSMDVNDFRDRDGKRLERLDAVKRVLDEFITRRETDRLGLIVFGAAPFLQMPLTRDHDALRTMLDEVRVGMAGEQTMIGDAIGLAVNLFAASERDSKVLVLLTDGNDTGSKIPVEKAAEIAAGRGIRLYAVAIGDPRSSGTDAVDMEKLRAITAPNGGKAFLAIDRSQLDEVYASLDALEPEDAEVRTFRPRRPLYMFPLAAALGLVAAYHLAAGIVIGLLRRRRARATSEEVVA